MTWLGLSRVDHKKGVEQVTFKEGCSQHIPRSDAAFSKYGTANCKTCKNVVLILLVLFAPRYLTVTILPCYRVEDNIVYRLDSQLKEY